MAAEFGLERLGFLTLTFRDHVTDIREAQRRFNSLRSHVLSKRYRASIAVVERQKNGRIHFHLVTVLDQDIRTGFSFAAVERQDYRSASPALRAEWSFWRATSPKYGFGRTELLPVKSTAEGIATYVGKYIAKHIDARRPEDRGARLVRYTVNARRCGTRFAWAGLRGWLWRKKLAQFAARYDCASTEGLRSSFGSRWAFHCADLIVAEVLTEYPTGAHALADGRTGVEPEWVNVKFKSDRADDLEVPHFKHWPGAGAKGAPDRPEAVALPASIWDGIPEAIRAARITKPHPFTAIVPGGVLS